MPWPPPGVGLVLPPVAEELSGPGAHTAPLYAARAGPGPGSPAITYFLNPTIYAFGLVALG